MLQISQYILRGELRNSRTNSVSGWLEFAPDWGIHIELTGNFKGQLEGKHVKFTNPAYQPLGSLKDDQLPEVLRQLADRQIGVIGEVWLKRATAPAPTSPDAPTEESAAQAAVSQLEPAQERVCLHIEWYSQNGRVLVELINPELEYVDPRQPEIAAPPEFEPLGDRLSSEVAETYLDIGGHQLLGDDAEDELDDELDDEFDAETHDDGLSSDGDSDDDPYGLFDTDLDLSVAQSLGTDPETGDAVFDSADDSQWTTRGNRSWDEVLPGIDPETKAMYEQWDEIFEGRKDEPVTYLFETPLRLPPPDRVKNDEEAQKFVVAILAQLALLSVAVDVCQHYTPLQVYQLLMTEILPTAKVHPRLAASRMVQHYATSDHCAACEAYYEARYRERKDREQAERGNHDSVDDEHDFDDEQY